MQYRDPISKLHERDPILNARRFCNLAFTNMRLAESAKSAHERGHYRTLAKHYMFLAESEVEAVTKKSG